MDHKRIGRVVRREGELTHLYPRGDLRHGGAVLAAWSLLVSLALALLAALASGYSGIALQLVVGAVIAACVGFVGLGIWRVTSFYITLDPEATTYSPVAEQHAEPPVDGEPGKGKIRLPEGDVAFHSVRAVHLRARPTSAPSEGSDQGASDERFYVDVIVRHDDGGEEHETLLEDIQQVATPHSEVETGNDHAARAVKLDELVERLAPSSVEIAHQADALSAWLTAETVAGTLRVPFFDSCGEHALLRLPHELDMPLVERLRQYGAPPRPIDPPPRVEATIDEGGLHASWREDSVGVGLAGMAGMMLVAGGLVALVFRLSALPPLGTGALLLLIALSTYVLKGRFQLRVDGEGVSLKRPWRRERKIPLFELEAIRVSKVMRPKTLLISDAELVSCPMPSTVAARWLSHAVERALWTSTPSRPDIGPYR